MKKRKKFFTVTVVEDDGAEQTFYPKKDRGPLTLRGWRREIKERGYSLSREAWILEDGHQEEYDQLISEERRQREESKGGSK